MNISKLIKAQADNFLKELQNSPDAVMKRGPMGEVKTNIPHVLPLHSPTGFEWGYAGSGPADLALNILLKSGVARKEAEAMHQDFKFKFIANMPKEGGTIKAQTITDFINEWKPAGGENEA